MATTASGQTGTQSTLTIPQAYQRAVAWYQDEQFERAENACRVILDVCPEQPDSLVLISAIEARQGRLTAAETTLERAIAAAPDSPEIKRNAEVLQAQLARVRSTPYVRAFLKHRQMFLDYPNNVAVELTGRCNGKCTFCPHSELDRRHTDMPDELFDKIVADLQIIPADHQPIFYTNVVNEPFLDRKIFQRLEAINKQLPGWAIYIHSNLNTVPENFFERICEVRNISTLSVSLNAANESEYRRLMGIDFHRTVGNIRDFLTKHRRRPFLPRPLILTRIQDFTEGDKQYIRECRLLFEGFEQGKDFEAEVKRRANWLGWASPRQPTMPYAYPCKQWLNLSILANGIVPHCCMDARGEHAIGDVRRNSVLEIYNSPPFRRLRKTLTARESAYPCNTCDLM